eukprot:CAMPEP_0119311114 /NCGR_PEP_ID=MMETSP1333-20130426/21769_1 /TAXON_ID=418940 /ORGANISM="Scyphosphaera apsteinii, Strain RCC1455" /LENGTH=162 /DNA_ID=CAMNT_0007315425 /DNA_START=68 /DNA_END=556 /DNA_ORIENTATION=+
METEFDYATDAEASHTIPMQAGHIRKGSYIMVRARPCRVLSVDTKAPGKHGHAKCHFVGQDLFTSNKMELIVPAGHNTPVPVVKKTDMLFMWCSKDGYISCMDHVTCKTRSDLKMPLDVELSSRIQRLSAEHGDEREVSIIVLAACGEEAVIDVKMGAPHVA